MKKFCVMLLTVLLLAGCGNSTYDKAMEEAKLAMASGEFDKAMGLYELALEEKPDDKEANKSYQRLTELNMVKEAMEAKEWDEVVKKASSLIENKNIESSIKKELQTYIKMAELSKAEHKEVSEKVKTIKQFVQDSKNDEALNLITELKQEEREADVLTQFSKEIDEMEQTAKDQLAKQKEAEELAAKQKEEKEAAEREAAAKRKAEYIRKLDNIEKGLADLDYLYANGITIEMQEAESETYKRWDDALNEIYGVLKNHLSSDEMDRLKEEQRQWIKDRDQTAEKESAEFKGGTMEPLQYTSTLARLTKERCYELVEEYM